MTCSNCNAIFNPKNVDYLELRHNDTIVSIVCGLCLDTVSKARITVDRKTTTGEFVYLQYVPVEVFPTSKTNEVQNRNRRT